MNAFLWLAVGAAFIVLALGGLAWVAHCAAMSCKADLQGDA